MSQPPFVPRLGQVDSLEERIQKIEARNASVEANKRWETSGTRRVAIAVLTYVIIVCYSWLLGASKPWLQALVPVMGFLISTFTLSVVRGWWERRGEGTNKKEN